MKKKVLTALFFIAFLACGLTGYYFSQGGSTAEEFFVAVYSTIALCFVNPVSDIENIYVYFAKAMGVVIAAGIILSFLKAVSSALSHRLISLRKDSTAVYTDSELGEVVKENLKHGFISTKETGVEKTKNHIVMFEEDEKNISFYAENKSKKGNFYILLNEMDTSLFDSDIKDGTNASRFFEDNVYYFNIYDMLARKYWKENSFYSEIKEKKNIKVAILGCGKVGRAVFKYGFLNNIYSLDQNMEYHLFGCTPEDAEFFGKELSTDNRDIIIVHEEDYHFAYKLLATMDRIILADIEDKMYILQQLLYKDINLNIHIFAEQAGEVSFLAAPNVKTFGDLKSILTEDNIKTDSLYRLGKLFNYDYTLCSSSKEDALKAGIKKELEEAMEKEWRGLKGFHKASSLARADHYWIEMKLVQDEDALVKAGTLKEEDRTSEEAFMRMEHIRWDRFHFINHWTYAEKRDNSRRKHPLLVPFDQLPPEEKKKDTIGSELLKREIERIINSEQ